MYYPEKWLIDSQSAQCPSYLIDFFHVCSRTDIQKAFLYVSYTRLLCTILFAWPCATSFFHFYFYRLNSLLDLIFPEAVQRSSFSFRYILFFCCSLFGHGLALTASFVISFLHKKGVTELFFLYLVFQRDVISI